MYKQIKNIKSTKFNKYHKVQYITITHWSKPDTVHEKQCTQYTLGKISMVTKTIRGQNDISVWISPPIFCKQKINIHRLLIRHANYYINSTLHSTKSLVTYHIANEILCHLIHRIRPPSK